MRIEILDEAQEDLIEGFRFYENREPGVGSYFLDCPFSDIDSLILFAGIHQVIYGYHLATRNPKTMKRNSGESVADGRPHVLRSVVPLPVQALPFCDLLRCGRRIDSSACRIGLSQKSFMDQETAQTKRLTNRFRRAPGDERRS